MHTFNRLINKIDKLYLSFARNIILYMLITLLLCYYSDF